MEPLSPNGIEPAYLGGAEKRSSERDTELRRKRLAAVRNPAENDDPAPEIPKHALDDLV
jgi:hypothetical protein